LPSIPRGPRAAWSTIPRQRWFDDKRVSIFAKKKLNLKTHAGDDFITKRCKGIISRPSRRSCGGHVLGHCSGRPAQVSARIAQTKPSLSFAVIMGAGDHLRFHARKSKRSTDLKAKRLLATSGPTSVSSSIFASAAAQSRKTMLTIVCDRLIYRPQRERPEKFPP